MQQAEVKRSSNQNSHTDTRLVWLCKVTQTEGFVYPSDRTEKIAISWISFFLAKISGKQWNLEAKKSERKRA
jgi:hypothetical protein